MIFGIGNKKWWNFKKMLLKLGKICRRILKLLTLFVQEKK